MQTLVRGVRRFRDDVFVPNRDEYRRLAAGQKPHSLFIACSDSRLGAELITSSQPGDIFVLRNAGNLVPPYGAAEKGGEAATIEYAVAGLGVKNIVICGHSACGAMRAILQPESCANLPKMGQWLTNADCTRAVVDSKYAGVTDFAQRWRAAVEENVIVQLEHLKTHPTVAAGLASESLAIYGWVFDLYSGTVASYDPSHGEFVPLPDDPEQAIIPTSVPFRNGRAMRSAM